MYECGWHVVAVLQLAVPVPRRPLTRLLPAPRDRGQEAEARVPRRLGEPAHPGLDDLRDLSDAHHPHNPIDLAGHRPVRGEAGDRFPDESVGESRAEPRLQGLAELQPPGPPQVLDRDDPPGGLPYVAGPQGPPPPPPRLV